MIIGIVGKAGHGKDTLADMIIEEYSKENTILETTTRIKRKEDYRPFEKARFADGLKKACAAITSYPLTAFYDRENYSHVVKPLEMTIREMMQKVGEGMREVVHPDIWINTALMRCKANGNYLFCDVKYPNEIKRIKDVGGKIIWIKREGYVDSTLQTEESKNHSSETALENYPLQAKSDLIVNNVSLEQLRHTVKTVVIKAILKWEDNLKSGSQFPKEATP